MIELRPASLPSSLESLNLAYNPLRSIPTTSLPPSIQRLHLEHTQLTALPADLASMLNLEYLSFFSAQLRNFVYTDNLATLNRLDLSRNQLESFQANLPQVIYLNLSSNALTEYNVVQGISIETLDLQDNQLTSIPPSIVLSHTKLLTLDIRGNPMQQLRLSQDEYAALRRVGILYASQDQFAMDCASPLRLSNLRVCTDAAPPARRSSDPQSEDGSSPFSSSWLWLGTLLVVGVVAGVALVAWQWTARHRKSAQRDMLHQNEVESLLRLHPLPLTNSALLKNRLEAAHVQRLEPYESLGAMTQWTATYHQQRVIVRSVAAPIGENAQATVDALHALVREAIILCSLDHAKIQRILGLVWSRPSMSDIALVLPPLSNGTLQAYINARPGHALTKLDVGILVDVIEALVYCHSLDPVLIHNDVCARNVALDDAFAASLIGFGRALYVSSINDHDFQDFENQGNLNLSATRSSWGGVDHTIPSPEYCGERIDTSVDVFGFGGLIKAMLGDEYSAKRSEEDSSMNSFLLDLAAACCAQEPSVRPTAIQVAYQLRQQLHTQPILDEP